MARRRRLALPLLAAAGVAAVAGVATGAAGDLSVVSVSGAGAQGASAVEAAAVSADGRFVAFTSAADLSGTPTGGKRQLYVRDRVAGTTKLASASAAGAASNGDVEADGGVGNIQFAISADGRYVAFAAAGSNLSPDDADATLDVFRKDMTTGAIALVSVSSTGQKANAAVLGDPDISADGSRISFGSGSATNLFTDGNGVTSDVVVRDVPAGSTTLAAQSTAGAQSNTTTERSAISADGRVVTFEAVNVSNLVPDDTGAGNTIIVRNLAAGTTAAATDPAEATAANFPDISGDGRYVVFETGVAYDPVNDAGGNNDVYRRDMGTGAIVLVSARDGQDVAGNAGGIRPAVSADGTRVAFASTSTNLTATDSNAAVKDVFTRDVATKATRLASVRADGTTQSNVNDSDRAAIAANGGAVGFVYDDNGAATKLVATETNNQPDALLKELAPTDAAGPSLTLTGPADGSAQRAAQVAVAGSAADPSGVSGVRVAGNPVTLTPAGGFSTSVPLVEGANPIAVAATDGAGNVTTRTVTVTRLAPTPAKKVLGLSASLVRGRIVVKIRLSEASRVRFSVLRRTVGPPPKRKVSLRRVGRPVVKTVQAGRRTIRLIPPTRRPGRYVVRVQIVGLTGAATTRTDGFRILPR